MKYDLSDEQKMMQQSCRSYVDKVVLPFIKSDWRREWDMKPGNRLPPEILQGAEAVGIRALGVPEEYGGIELDPASEVQTFALISEEIARGDFGLADKLVQNWKVTVLLRELAAEHLKKKWFARLIEDPQFLLAHCLTEPRGASDRWLPYNVPEAAMTTRAVRDGDEWVINGRKQFISNGYDAGLYVVYANTNPKAGVLDGTSSFLVPRDTPGLTVARCNETLGCRFMNNGELVFEDMRLPADHLLTENDAMKKAGAYFKAGKIIQAAKNSASACAASRSPPTIRRITCRAAAFSSSIRRWRCGLPIWRRRSSRCGRWSSAPPRRSTPRRRRPTISATWPRCSPRKRS